MIAWGGGVGLHAAGRVARAVVALVAGWCMVACADDETVLPAYVQTLAELHTGNAADARQTLVLEDGTRQAMLNRIDGLPADTLIRVYVVYTRQPDQGGVLIHNAQRVFSPRALRLDPSETLHADPVDLISVWKTGQRWLNLHLGIRRGNGANHTCGFVEEWLPQRESGGLRLRLTLYHDRQGDPAYYTEDAYFSCPLRHYADSLRVDRDSLEICVNTPSGNVVRRFAY